MASYVGHLGNAPNASSELSAASILRVEAHNLFRAQHASELLQILDRIAAIIDMPKMAWTPDVANPHYVPEMEAFIDRQGWPPELVDLWRDKGAATKVRFYARCRYTNLPFVTALERPSNLHRRKRHSQTFEERTAERILKNMGYKSLITAPAHLPHGRVSMLTWAGPRTPSSAKRLVEIAGVELIAITHLVGQRLGPVSGTPHPEPQIDARLTSRERDCLRLVAQGFSEREAGDALGISHTTVRYHVDNAALKLNAKNRTHAAVISAQLGLLGSLVDADL